MQWLGPDEFRVMSTLQRKVYRRVLKNIEALAALDPYAAAARKAEARAAEARAANKDAVLAKRRASKKSKKANKAGGVEFYEKASKQGDVCEEGF